MPDAPASSDPILQRVDDLIDRARARIIHDQQVAAHERDRRRKVQPFAEIVGEVALEREIVTREELRASQSLDERIADQRARIDAEIERRRQQWAAGDQGAFRVR